MINLNSSVDIQNLDSYYDTDLVGVAKRRGIYASEVQDAILELAQEHLDVLSIKMTDDSAAQEAGTDVMFVTNGGNFVWYPDQEFELVETVDDETHWLIVKNLIKDFAKELGKKYDAKILAIWNDDYENVLSIDYDEIGSWDESKIFPRHTKEVQELFDSFMNDRLLPALKPLPDIEAVRIEMGPAYGEWEV
jgi:hypothetical protein